MKLNSATNTYFFATGGSWWSYDVTAVWQPNVCNTIYAWDTISNYYYCSPFHIVHILEVPRVNVKFEAQAGKINYGFDPTEAEPWTSVGVGSTQQVVQLNIGSGTDPSKISLAVPASDKVWVSQTNNFSLDANPLTISGLSPTNDATVVVHYSGLTNAIAALHVMVLPWITNSIGIYEIEDPQSTNTWQVGAPSATNILNELNSVYTQACVHFELANLTPTNVVVNYSYDNGGETTDALEKWFFPGDGKMETCEMNSTNLVNFLDLFSSNKASECVYFFRRSGMRSTLGWTPPRSMWSGVLTHKLDGTSSPLITLIVAHEVGHLLDLSTRDDVEDDGERNGHDLGTPPSGTGMLMRPFIDKPALEPEPRWMRHDDWWKANDTAGAR